MSKAEESTSAEMSAKTSAEERYPWLRALGPQEMPESIDLEAGCYRHLRTFKHDFFAATGLYEGPTGRAVLKMGRNVGLFGLPLKWLGRWLAEREARHYRLVEDISGVPKCFGTWSDTGFVHEFVEGHPIQKNEKLSDTFFQELEELLDGIHARHMAYADLEKRENILVDSEGRPSLIDFQISWYWPPKGAERQGPGRFLPDALGRWILLRLTHADSYHLMKHRRRLRRDQLSEEEIAASYRVSGGIRWHRRLTKPFTWVRRKGLKVLTGDDRSPKQDGPEFLDNHGGVAPPTDAVGEEKPS